MNRAQKFRRLSLSMAVCSTILYWLAYADNARVTAERRATLAATAMPIPLNGFRLQMRGVLPLRPKAAEATADGKSRLLFVVNDDCPGSGVAVPQWIDWIRSSPHHDYSAVIVSIEGTNYMSQLASALEVRAVKTVALRVAQQESFALSSGVSVTPTLLGIDRSGTVRFASGIFSQAAGRGVDRFLEMASGLSPSE